MYEEFRSLMQTVHVSKSCFRLVCESDLMTVESIGVNLSNVDVVMYSDVNK